VLLMPSWRFFGGTSAERESTNFLGGIMVWRRQHWGSQWKGAGFGWRGMGE
jgi:hypothetical protein